MARNWNRKIQVILDSRAIELDDFDITFSYNFTIGEEPNEFEIGIKNLSQNTINSYIAKDKQCIINAGYEGDVGNIARGFIIDTDTGWNNTDKDTRIIGFDSSEDYLNKYISKSYKEGTMALEIIRDICSLTGLAIGEVTLKKNAQYVRGRSVTGRLRDVLKEIVEQDCETNLQVINGTILIRNIEQGLVTGFILSPTTGLIGSPEPITDVDDSVIPEHRPEYKVKCLLNYKLSPMARIRIESKYLVAEAVVINGSHRGSKSGDFMSEVEVRLI